MTEGTWVNDREYWEEPAGVLSRTVYLVKTQHGYLSVATDRVEFLGRQRVTVKVFGGHPR
jgi:hypothetical protein